MSNHIYIEHNPFTIETKFLINGKDPSENSTIRENQNKRLQLWIEGFFQKLDQNEFNDYGAFEVTFKGIQSDYLDVAEAVEDAKKDGLQITLNWQRAKDPQKRLAQIEKLIDEAKKHPLFGDQIKNNEHIQQNLIATLNKDFDVYVAATMSAGKSTLINAMLGFDLLPAANEATTATIAQITNNKKKKVGEFTGKRIDKDGKVADVPQSVTLDTLRKWNSLEDTSLIKLEGNIIGVSERDEVRLVITDTPGPNNSQDSEHARTTMGYLQDSMRNPLILYILNATQLGTNDDKKTLGLIANIMKKGGKQSKDRFIFVVNKMDAFDPEQGENVADALERVRKYLESNGINDPQIYPVSANLARLQRKLAAVNGDFAKLTRSERGELKKLTDLFEEEPSMDMVQYMHLTSSVRENLNNENLSTVELHSGLPAVEAMIDDYINKYNLPNRVNRGYLALTEAIKYASDEQNLTKSLEMSKEDLDKLKLQLNALADSQNMTAKAKTMIELKVEDENNKSLFSKQAITSLNQIEGVLRKDLQEFSSAFKGEAEVYEAENKLSNLESDVKFRSNALINQCEQIIFQAQATTQEKLMEVFKEFSDELFQEVELPTLTLAGIKDNLSNFTIKSLQVSEIITEEMSEEVKVGERKVSMSKWYKPWTWGKERTEDIYETRTWTEETVSLDELWNKRGRKIEQHFRQLIASAIKKIDEDNKHQIEHFKNFVTHEFTEQMQAITKELDAKTADEEQLKKDIAQAEANLKDIKAFQARLDSLLNL